MSDPYLLFFLFVIQIILLLPLLYLCGTGECVSIMKNERVKERGKERERETGQQAWEAIEK